MTISWTAISRDGMFPPREAYQMADDLNDVVIHAASPMLSAQQKATLASLLTCFDVRRDQNTDKAVLGEHAMGELFSALETAIASRVSRAHDAALSLGDRPAKLRAFPRLIVEPMVASAKRAAERVTGDCERS